MTCEKLTLEKLGALSGGLFGFSLERHINQIVDDLDDRGTDGLPRKLVITITFRRLGDEVEINPALSVRYPDKRYRPTVAKFVAGRDGGTALGFQVASPENPDQPGLFRDGEEQQK